MYTLFWKIFLTYWLTIVIIEIFTAWFTADLSEYEIHPILQQQNQNFRDTTFEAVKVLENSGVKGLREWLSDEKNMHSVDELYVINGDQEDINNRPIPQNINEVLKTENSDDILADRSQPIRNILTFRVTTPAGSEHLVISTFKHPNLVSYLLAPQRVILGVFISGVICFFLARYFTSPLSRLRSSTHKLTVGEFDTSALQYLRTRNDEFGALAVDFEHMTIRLRDLLNFQQQMLRDISHELRSPLARVRVALGLARMKYQEMDTEELDRIEKEVEHFEFLIRELLTFVKMEAGNKNTQLTTVNLKELLNCVVEDARYEQQQSPGMKTLILDCAHEVEVMAEAHLLHRAIENIVRNACYYSPDNSVIRIHCLPDLEKKEVSITIEDEGPGVPDDMLEKIFQPFVRVSTAREADTGGSGIGLAIAKRVIDIHEGTIAACNNVNGRGLIVTILLPLFEDSGQEARRENQFTIQHASR